MSFTVSSFFSSDTITTTVLHAFAYVSALPCSYGIGIQAGSKMKLVTVPHCYSMEQRLKNHVIQEAKTSQPENMDEYRTQNQQLHEIFGSKKKRRQLAAAASNRVEPNKTLDVVLTGALDAEVKIAQYVFAFLALFLQLLLL